MKKKLVSGLLVAAMAASLVACGGTKDNTQSSGNNAASGDAIQNLIANTKDTVKLTLWCSEDEQWQKEMAKLVDEFKSEYKDVKFDITIGAVSEGNCKDELLKDVENGADVFVCADDQINELVQAGALQDISTTYTYDVAKSYGEDAVKAVSMNGKMYGYPLATNGYFLYYNTDFVTADQAKSWEGLLEAAKAKEDSVIAFDFGNAWYLYGWFSGAGLKCTLASNGTDNECNWNAKDTTPTGAAVAQYIQDFAKNPQVISIGDGDSRTLKATVDGKEKNIIAYVNGAWAAKDYEKALGDKLGACKLPTFKIDGKDYQMGGFKGYKVVGVNAYSKNVGWSMILAEYITNAKSQADIFENCGAGPANVDAAKSATSPAISASQEQLPFSDFQRVGGKFWDPAATLGASLAQGTVTDFQAALDDAVKGITAAN